MKYQVEGRTFRVGPRMIEVLLYVADHPGCSKREAAQATSCRSIGLGYEAVNRCVGHPSTHQLIRGTMYRGRYNLFLTWLGRDILARMEGE